MAIFGFHIVLTMITATFAHRFLPRFAPCSRLMAAYLHRYAMPTKPPDDETANGKPKGRRRNNKNINKESSDDVIYRVPVTSMDLSNVAFVTDMEIAFDFALASVIVLAIAGIRAYFFPCEAASETNLSLVWCWISLGLGMRTLFITLKIFMRESSFVSVCLTAGAVFALLSMVILSFPDNFVDLKLRESHAFIDNVLKSGFNETVEIDPHASTNTLNFNLFRGVLAIFSGFFGTMLTFPGLRFAKLYATAISKDYHNESIKDKIYNNVLRLVLHVTLLMPLVLILLWLKPLVNSTFNLKREGAENLLNSLRTAGMFFAGLTQVIVCIPLLQTHLDTAEKRVSVALSQANTAKPGRPAEKRVDLRKEVNIVSQSLGIVVVQILSPALMMIVAALLYKSILDVSWMPERLRSNCTSNATLTTNQRDISGSEMIGQLLSKVTTDDSLVNLATDLTSSVSRFRIAAGNSPALWQSTIGFAVFWMCTVQILTSMFGLWHARASVGDPEQGLF